MKARRKKAAAPTRKETALEKQIRAQGSIRRLRGKVKWEGDLEESRRARFLLPSEQKP